MALGGVAGVVEPSDPPSAKDPWQQAITDWLMGRRAETDLEAHAAATAGVRVRMRRLHESNLALALVAYRDGDGARELRHLRRVADLGDMGDVLDVWAHVRARSHDVRLPHHPPRVIVAAS